MVAVGIPPTTWSVRLLPCRSVCLSVALVMHHMHVWLAPALRPLSLAEKGLQAGQGPLYRSSPATHCLHA